MARTETRMIDWTGALLGIAALGIGGVLKGATGIGAPVLAVPLLSALYGVPTGIALFALPNLVLNGAQAWDYRAHIVPAGLILPLALAGLAGTGVGVWLLVSLPGEALLLSMALAVFAYLGFRLARPDWVLAMALARRIAAPAGFTAGVMFGAVGISAPISVTFFNALRLDRDSFVASISAFFFALALVQIPLLLTTGVMTPLLALGSFLAILPIWAGMALGARLTRHLSREMFDRLTLGLIGLIGVRMFYQALT
jgi:uncharacterized membrane protein YfcA